MSLTVCYNVGDAVILNNGYVGTIKFEQHPTFGIELNEAHPNGHNGKKAFKCQNGYGLIIHYKQIAFKVNIYKINGISQFTLNTNNDTIYFPTISQFKQFFIKQQQLLTFGYARDIAKNIENYQYHIPMEVQKLCLSYNSYKYKIGDIILLKNNEYGKIWSIGISEFTNKIYVGIHSQRQQYQQQHKYHTIQDIQKVNINNTTSFEIDKEFKLQIGLNVKLINNINAKIKYIGPFGDIDEIIGVELNNHNSPIYNVHDGKGYFECDDNKERGYFVDRSHIISMSNEEMTKHIPLIIKGCYSTDINLQYLSVHRIRNLLSIEHDPPIQPIIDSGIICYIFAFLCSEKRMFFPFFPTKNN